MRISKEKPSSSAAQETCLIEAVKKLQGKTVLELNELFKKSENFTINYPTKKGLLLLKMDMKKLAGSLPLHLTAVLMESDRDEAMFGYLLRGIRLLNSLCGLASRNSKLEQIFLYNIEVLEQLVDFVFDMLIVLAGCGQEDHAFSQMQLVHSTLVACNLYLLTGFISTKWEDIVHVLLAHPKIDMFMDAAFRSVRVVVMSLEIALLDYHNKYFSMESNLKAEQEVYYICQQCEASLQFLELLCEQKLFKERLLKNKELCRNGSILFLAQSILKLQNQLSLPYRIMAAISRLKSKMLSILLSLCEAESISYLDEIASSPPSLDLAKSIALEVFNLLKTAFGRDPGDFTIDRRHPMGFVQLNAMRLVEILSDDSHFRSYVIRCFTEVLAATVSLSHGGFLSRWCSSNLQETEEDASVEYDIFAAVGWILDSANIRNATNLEFNRIPNSMPRESYAHHKTSLFVQLFANLQYFVPELCEEQEKNVFVLKFWECLQMDLSNVLPGFSFASDAASKAVIVSKNLCSLLRHAKSLIPNFLKKEDVQLLRAFWCHLESLFVSNGSGENHAQSGGGCPLPSTGKEPVSLAGSNINEGMYENAAFPDLDQHNARVEDKNQGSDLKRHDQGEDKAASGKTASGGAGEIDKDAQNIDASGLDTSSAKGKNTIEHMHNIAISKSNESFKKVAAEENPEDGKVETTQRKRKRSIMNDKQVSLIERAILDEPDMHRNSTSLQSWANKLSFQGSEITSLQLKNWLNNRKAKLARTSRDVPAAASDVDNLVSDNQTMAPVLGSNGSPDGPSDVSHSQAGLFLLAETVLAYDLGLSLEQSGNTGSRGSGLHNADQQVVIVDKEGDPIGKGKMLLQHGEWYGKSLEESGTCVLDVSELMADDKSLQLPYSSEATGTTFEEAETKFGVMRVLWDLNRVFGLVSE